MTKRNDLAGKTIAVVGGSGFVGAHLAQELLARGARLRIASRHPERAFKAKPLGNLGQVRLMRCDVTKPASLAGVVAGADAVVNLVGAFDGDLDAVQSAGAGLVAAAARDAGAGALVHVSAIGADAESSVAYARTKAAGEAAVLAAFPTATVLRPSVLFGADDHFINMFAGFIASLPVVPVFGPQARLQPLFVDDAAEAIGNALAAPAVHGGKTYEIAGPEAISVIELNRRIAAAAQRSPLFIELPDVVSGILAAIPGVPMSSDQWKLLKQGNVASDALPGIEALGVSPRPLGLFLDRWMVRYRNHGRFGAKAAA